jgi:hypothetical protein
MNAELLRIIHLPAALLFILQKNFVNMSLPMSRVFHII